MENKKILNALSFEKKMQFLLWIHEAEDCRRVAIENKSSILIASNAIIVGAITGFVFPLIPKDNPLLWFQILLSIFALGSTIISFFFCLLILYPINSKKQRAKIMEIDVNSEYNLFLFLNISTFKKMDYQKAINKLDEEKTLEQVTSEIHNLSRILVSRYRYLQYASIPFFVTLLSFAVLSFTKLFH